MVTKEQWERMGRSSGRAFRRDVSMAKRRLVIKAKVKGIYENFGQSEIRKLKDRYHYSALIHGSQSERRLAGEIDSFEDWAISYTGR